MSKPKSIFPTLAVVSIANHMDTAKTPVNTKRGVQSAVKRGMISISALKTALAVFIADEIMLPPRGNAQHGRQRRKYCL